MSNEILDFGFEVLTKLAFFLCFFPSKEVISTTVKTIVSQQEHASRKQERRCLEIHQDKRELREINQRMEGKNPLLLWVLMTLNF